MDPWQWMKAGDEGLIVGVQAGQRRRREVALDSDAVVDRAYPLDGEILPGGELGEFAPVQSHSPAPTSLWIRMAPQIKIINTSINFINDHIACGGTIKYWC